MAIAQDPLPLLGGFHLRKKPNLEGCAATHAGLTVCWLAEGEEVKVPDD